MKNKRCEIHQQSLGIRMFTQTEPGEFLNRKGLMLTTGSAEGAKGPNNSPSTSFANNVVPRRISNFLVPCKTPALRFYCQITLHPPAPLPAPPISSISPPSNWYPHQRRFASYLNMPLPPTSSEYTEFNDTLPDFLSPFPAQSIIPKNQRSTSPPRMVKHPSRYPPSTTPQESDYYTPNDFKTNPKIFKTGKRWFTKVMECQSQNKTHANLSPQNYCRLYGDPFTTPAIFSWCFCYQRKSPGLSPNQNNRGRSVFSSTWRSVIVQFGFFQSCVGAVSVFGGSRLNQRKCRACTGTGPHKRVQGLPAKPRSLPLAAFHHGAGLPLNPGAASVPATIP